MFFDYSLGTFFSHLASTAYRTCEIETAFAEVAQESANNESMLPLQPKTPEDIVFTHFWVDNLDVLVDKQVGGIDVL